MRNMKLENRRGAVVVVVAIMMVVIIGFAAFAIDTGMLFSGRSDAQRAGDAAALAAATAFLDAPLAERAAMAEERGTDFATRNQLLRTPIQEDEVTIQLLVNTTAALRVRATVRREAVPTLFAGIFGRKTLPVAALAEAEVRNSSAADCLKPFALPDNTFGTEGGIPWGALVPVWIVGGEEYVLVGYNDNQPPGLGNIEKSIADKCTDGNSAALDDNLLWEKPGSAQPGQGGDGVGQVMNGMEKLIASDPNLSYDDFTGSFNRDDWASSPRVGNVVVYDYDVFKEAGINQVRVTDFARVFFSHTTGQAANPQNPYTVWGRVFPMEGLAGGACGEEGCDSNAFIIRLVR
jgi:hypothetical protein